MGIRHTDKGGTAITLGFRLAQTPVQERWPRLGPKCWTRVQAQTVSPHGCWQPGWTHGKEPRRTWGLRPEGRSERCGRQARTMLGRELQAPYPGLRGPGSCSEGTVTLGLTPK